MRGGLLAGVAVLAIAAAAYALLPGASVTRPPPAARRPPAQAAPAELRARGRVILVTLDGARWQDVFDSDDVLAGSGARPAMPALLGLVRENGVALRAVTSSRVPLSLPGYQALAAGRTTPCEDNDCGQIGVETLAEAVARRLGLEREQVAVFASWSRVARAAAAHDGAVLVDAPADGPTYPGGPPWEDARWDADTVELALAHFRAHRPRFMHVALLDMDERAHLGQRAETVEALRAADRSIARLLDEVARLPADERRLTTLLVTADHGRGPGRLWTAHGAYPQARNIFVLAVGDLVRGGGPEAATSTRVHQADVRPTIERLLGLCSSDCSGERCGAPLPEIVGELGCGP